jgi:hypothetical protein
VASVDQLEREAASSSLAPVAFRRIVPSLEDAFIALIRRTGQENRS